MPHHQPIAVSVAIGGVVTTGIALAAIFWPERLTPEAQALIIAFANALILAAVSIWAAARSTPLSNPTLPANTSVSVAGTQDHVIIQPTPPGPTGIDEGP